MGQKRQQKQQKRKNKKEKQIAKKIPTLNKLENIRPDVVKKTNTINKTEIFKENIVPTLCLVRNIEETKKEIEDYYEALKEEIETETNKESIFYGVEFKKEIVVAIITVDDPEIGINIYPIIDGEHEYDCGFGNDKYIATLKNCNAYNKPSFALLKDVILNLMEPVSNKISKIDWSELEDLCGNAQGQLNIEIEEPEEIELPELLKEKPDINIIKKQFSEIMKKQIEYHIKNKIPGNIIIQGLPEKIIPIINSEIFKNIVESEEFEILKQKIPKNTEIIFKIYQHEMQIMRILRYIVSEN